MFISQQDQDAHVREAQLMYGSPQRSKAGQMMTVLELDRPSGAQDAPVSRMMVAIFLQALQERASDVHIEALEKSVRVRLRIDGLMHEVATLPLESHGPLMSRLKVLGKMDIAEKRLPQDGRFFLKRGNCTMDVRVATMPALFGEKAVCRILDKDCARFSLDGLGFTERSLEVYSSMIRQPHGLVLITGPTGSGKSTTLYATMQAVQGPEKNVVTIEDPIEYVLEGITQMQINPKAGLTFANGLRSLVRQDPDIIMVGEIRDAETAEIAVRAATTGHLVFSTLHTNDALGAIGRLGDMGIPLYLLASALVGVVSQRLVRQICPHCKMAYCPAPLEVDRLLLGVSPEEEIRLYRGAGCALCRERGYLGRVAVTEVVAINGKMRRMIAEHADMYQLFQQARRDGMVTLYEDGLRKVREGWTTLQEIMRVVFCEETEWQIKDGETKLMGHERFAGGEAAGQNQFAGGEVAGQNRFVGSEVAGQNRFAAGS
ncbi:GspE/PulE family protein [Heliophilum fasciatum]|uniref:Type IV pilus assembly protein PilB n=1 Tax=Heliophilum fasciatum TaxID=35700 RepID=A0A4V2SXQ2_9FIRM|nr:GspE/PulE family protein [Heliophilum fasciatum]MCW2277309.1 type IV pilus assembly protein PilB [Heliophilum fasciatum]TCP67146.1 type IV pilus assembly protein PilB [Heliophilum fasciatum]